MPGASASEMVALLFALGCVVLGFVLAVVLDR